MSHRPVEKNERRQRPRIGYWGGQSDASVFFYTGSIDCLLPPTGATRVPEILSSDKWNALIVVNKPRVAWGFLRGRHSRKHVLATRPVGARGRTRTHLAGHVPRRTERLPKRALGASAPGEGSRQRGGE